MKQIKPETALEQLLQPMTESTEEALSGGVGITLSLIIHSSVETGSGTLIPVKVKHNA